MLTNEDINKLAAVLATKEDLERFYNKSEIDEKFGVLQTSVDGIAKKVDAFDKENIVHKHKANRVEAWVMKAAAKVGLDYNP